jgi:hypothetical protein
MSLLRSATDRVVVESGVFGLQDVDTASTPVPWPQDLLAAGDGMRARPNRLDIECAVRDLRVPVRLEAWDGPPPEHADADDDSSAEEAEVDLSSGTVRLWELTGGGSSVTFTVGAPGRYLVRCAVTGQTEAVMREAAGERVPDGTVAYTLSFWPAA